MVRRKGKIAMLEEQDQAISEVGQLLFICLYEMQRTTVQDWQSLNLSMAQLKVLLTLSFKGAMAISKIGELLSISHPTASHLVEKLVQAQLVAREEDPADRRATLAHLTTSGEALARRLWQGRNEHLANCLRQIDQQDLAALRQGLRALNKLVELLPTSSPAGHEHLENGPLA